MTKKTVSPKMKPVDHTLLVLRPLLWEKYITHGGGASITAVCIVTKDSITSKSLCMTTNTSVHVFSVEHKDLQDPPFKIGVYRTVYML
jgi:hypothetical protein